MGVSLDCTGAVVEYIQDTQIDFDGQVIKLYPAMLKARPKIPSPCRTDDGREFLTVRTDKREYSVIPVTITPKVALVPWHQPLEIDVTDFPTLARTGVHSDLELDLTRSITGRSLAEITELGRPDRLSTGGFMCQDEDIISVIRGDNRLALRLGMRHPELARPLLHLCNLIREAYPQTRQHRQTHTVFYAGREVYVDVLLTRGGQKSIFNDGIDGAWAIEIRRDLTKDEREFLDRQYPNLTQDERDDLTKRLSQILSGEMQPFYIWRYGFYEGHTAWRSDPIAIAFIFGLKSIEEIESAFPRQLPQVLTHHFARKRAVASAMQLGVDGRDHGQLKTERSFVVECGSQKTPERDLVSVLPLGLCSLVLFDGAQERNTDTSAAVQRHVEALHIPNNKEAMDALVAIGAPAVGPLVVILNEPLQGSVWEHRNVTKVLGRIGGAEAERGLLGALQNDKVDNNVRRFAAEAVGQLGSPQVREALLATFQDKSLDIQLRATALYEVKNYPSEEVVDLLKIAMHADEAPIHYRAGEALAEIGTPVAIEALVEGLRVHPACLFDAEVREALVKTPTEDAIRVLVKTLGADRWTVRTNAEATLEEMGKSAVPHLVRAVEDTNPLTRWHVLVLLRKLQGMKATETLLKSLDDDHWMIRNEAAVALAKLNNPCAAERLTGMLDDDRPQAQLEAAWILGEMRAASAVPALQSMLENSKSSARWMSAISLGKIRPRESSNLLIRQLRADDLCLRRAAAWALAQGASDASDKALAALQEACKDDDREVRLWATVALEKAAAANVAPAVVSCSRPRRNRLAILRPHAIARSR
jgi:HEAT repeat protein